jgi:hypothetical protein
LSATARVASRRAAIERRALGELSALTSPDGDAAQWKAMLRQTEVELVEVVNLAGAARAKDSSAVSRQIRASEGPQLRLLAAADKSGVGRCAVVG